MPLLSIPYAEISEHSIPREASGLRMDDASVGIMVLLLLVQEAVKESLHDCQHGYSQPPNAWQTS